MKIFQKLKVAALQLFASNQVAAYFLDPLAGSTSAYHEGDFLGGTYAVGVLTDATKGKQVIVSRGTKFQVLAFDSDDNFASALPARSRNAHWFAPDANWIKVVLPDLDQANSAIIIGNNETVSPTFNIATPLPFKKVGNTIVFDSTLGTINPTTVSGLNNTTTVIPTTTTTTTTPTGTTTTPTTANASAKTGVAGWAWYIWAIIGVAVIGSVVLIKSLFGGKGKGKGKVVGK